MFAGMNENEAEVEWPCDKATQLNSFFFSTVVLKCVAVEVQFHSNGLHFSLSENGLLFNKARFSYGCKST